MRSSLPSKLRWIFVVALAAWAGLSAFGAGPVARVAIDPQLPGIGRSTQILIEVEERWRGLSDLTVELVQDGRIELLEARSFEPRAPWAFWRDRRERELIVTEVGSDTVADLEEGVATIRLTAARAPAWLRRPEPTVTELALPVRLRPPKVEIVSSLHYPAQGGSEVVVYRTEEGTVRDGVQAGEAWFPGQALPGGEPGQRFCLYGVPFDLEEGEAIQVVAVDDVGNEARVRFVDRFLARGYERDEIRLSDRFMEAVVPRIVDRTPGLERLPGLLDSYLAINRDLRQGNARELARLAESSKPEFLWTDSFVALPNAKVMSAFADRRTYVYDGLAVDQQDHLGFDLASVRRAEVPAANSGVVVLAKYFGIYGNAVVIDHGYGLMSLYGHLSSIEVEKGARVERGQIVGRTGDTGLAGGDHLHFTMLLGGQAVNPIEWWDAGWIRDRIRRKLGGALPSG